MNAVNRRRPSPTPRVRLPPVHLDRVILDGLLVRRHSATLHSGGGDHPGTRASAWWAYIACRRLPGRYDAGSRPIAVEALLIDGRKIRGRAKIVERCDDAYGTKLIVAGIEPFDDDPFSQRTARPVIHARS